MRRLLMLTPLCDAIAILLTAAVTVEAHELEFYAFIDDFGANPSTTDGTGEAFFTLNHEQTEIRYTIVLDKSLVLKPHAADRTEPDDVIGMHIHLHVPDAIGPHVLNIFGLPAEEDADLVIDYDSNTLTGVYDISDATLDPATGLPALQFYPLTTKIIYDWVDELMEGDLMLAVHTNESGLGTMAIYGHIGGHSHTAPEPSSGVIAAAGTAVLWLVRRRQIARCSRPFGCALVILIALTSAAPSRAQPSEIGQWSDEFTWGQFGGIEAIHVHMLPTGKVMFWQSWRDSIGLWDPVTSQFSSAALPNPSSSNPFCSGHAWLPDGRLMVVGGHNSNNNGQNRANIYDPFTNMWANNVPNMPSVPSGAPYGVGRNGRWYPSATTLGNGDILVMSGDMDGSPPAGQSDTNPLPQVYEVASNSWRNLTTAYRELPLYPRTFLAPDGNVVSLADYSNRTRFLNPSGTGQWLTYSTTTLDSDLVNYGPAVMYDAGKIAYIGGGHAPTQNVSMIDLNQSNPTWSYGADDMAQPRRQNNATILADGKVLITGGSSTTGWNDPAGLVTVAEIWDPVTQEVTQVAQANPTIYRGYHSTALLLPDGRVLVTGGNHDHDNNPSTPEIENKNAEIFSPAYLFNGPRPTVNSAPDSAHLGHTIFVETPDAADIADVTIIVPGSVTHAQNWTQRANHLPFNEVEGGLAITLPSNPNAAPPGYYMMFLINNDGVPSMAEWIQALPPTETPPGDFNNDGTVDAADYVVWRRTDGTLGGYYTWRANFGATGGGGAAARQASAVPEPITLRLLLAGTVGLLGLRRAAYATSYRPAA